MNPKSFLYSNRKEVELLLQIKEGKLPEDIYGVVYITSMCGSLNSKGTPIPEKHPGDDHINPEYGTPLLAGDGMIFKIDFNCKGEVHLKTSINKTPCYYADLATCRENSPTLEKKFQHYGFKSMGLSRASAYLGFRNVLNVALAPVQFSTDRSPRMLVTFDAGRPWEFNTKTLELITPVGSYKEWIKASPVGLKFPFYSITNSAHPSFDPLTKELYTVNYTQEKSISYKIAFLILLLEHRDEAKKYLEEKGNIFDSLWSALPNQTNHLKAFVEELKQFFETPHLHERFKDLITSVLHKYRNISQELKNLDLSNEVYLVRWNGKQGPLKKWKVIDEQGQDIIIDECMHQTALTEDYILLSDSSFKFAADIMISNPFPEVPVIDKMLRRLLNKQSPVDTVLYLIKRNDLNETSEIVRAKRIPMPENCIHFTVNYKNPEGNITLYTINSNSVCVAEWIRPYDSLKIGGKKVYTELVGLPAQSGVDLNSLSRYKINFETGITNRLDCQTLGGQGPGQIMGPHTWEVALFTYRDMVSPDKTVDEIKNLFVFSAGLNSERLTEFIFDLFKDVPDKFVSTDEILKYTKAGVPQVLFRLDAEQMVIKDFFFLDFNIEIRSIQFIPGRYEKENVEYSLNGYILCVMLVGENKIPNAPATMNYERELWLFDARDLAKGPVCKLYHPDLSYAFTLHSAWIENAQPEKTEYHVNIREDFESPESFLPDVQKNGKEFLEKYVLPYFETEKKYQTY
jgi:carotenoid cleavage dioxygenase-like enzyme